MSHQYYCTEQRGYVTTETWAEHVALVNKTTAILEQTPYYEALEHEDINVLPSAHPWWRFQAYLATKALYVKTLRTHQETSRILSPDLNPETASRIHVYLKTLEDQAASVKQRYRQRQQQLHATTAKQKGHTA